MKPYLTSSDPLNLCTGNASNGRVHKSWRIYNREGNELRTVATLESDKLTGEAEHNLAQLFAAAPELLDALDEIQGTIEAYGFDGVSYHWIVEKAAKAIQKATGQPA